MVWSIVSLVCGLGDEKGDTIMDFSAIAIILTIVGGVWKLGGSLGKLGARGDGLCSELQRTREELHEHHGELRELRADVCEIKASNSRPVAA